MKTRLLYITCLLIVVLMSFPTITAQTRKGTLTANSTTEKVNKYFSDNILLLDPIEGVYSVEEVNKGWNNYRTFPDRTTNYYMIILKKWNGYYTNIGRETTLKIWRVGETNVYDTNTQLDSPNGKLWMSKRIVMENGLFFSYSLDLPIPYDGVGSRGRLNFNYVKIYPTASMYKDAVAAEAKRIQEEQGKVTDWSGSGFALSNGYLCTNYHVVEGAKSIKIYGVQGNFNTSYSARVVALDKVNDLAILKVDDTRFYGFGNIPYCVKTTMDEVGEDIFVLGYPLTTTMGDEIKLTTGVISARTGFQGDVSMYQISAPIQPGNSGGPLFDSKGDLVGIVSAKHTGAENVGYAIKTSYLQNLISSSLSSDILPKNNTVSSQPLTGKVSRLKNFVFYIECSSREEQTTTIPTNTFERQDETEDNPKPYEGYEIPEGTTIHLDVKNPYVRKSPESLSIKRVRVTDEQTVVDFEYDNSKSRYAYGWWVNISSSTCIVTDTGTELKLTKADGIPIAPTKHHLSSKNEKLSFTLVFPALPENTTKFDLIESAESSWKFYGICLE